MFIIMTIIFVQRPTRNVALMRPEHEDCFARMHTSVLDKDCVPKFTASAEKL